MKNILGVSAGFHDASITVINDQGEILFAGHSERYSKKKNDAEIATGLVAEADRYGYGEIAIYERPWLHNIQQFWSGQKSYGPWTARKFAEHHLGLHRVTGYPVKSYGHHLSHAAAGFQTSTFDQAAVVVIDAIGELDTISIYRAWYNQNGQACYKRVWRQRYPHSIGLFYSAITKSVGLRPMEEEYITMGMAAYGTDLGAAHLMNDVVADREQILFNKNLHVGFDSDEWQGVDVKNLAAAAQNVTEQLIMSVMRRARHLVDSNNLVYMGGVALNCVANSRLGQIYDNIWIMPNPGDSGSSLGAAALVYGKHIHWKNAFLGHDIMAPYPVNELLERLCTDRIVGVANGRAEFGPRALGNRSLLADPRGTDIKDRVNEIKRRQKFRPFAPVILAEMVNEYFEMPSNWKSSDYMQVVARCRHPDLYPAICHVDGTSRVQTVPQDGSGIRQLLEKWYAMTDCPMLLNTSLNIRGEPMVNDRADADRFEIMYNVKVLS